MAASSSGRRRKGDGEEMIRPIRGGASSSEDLMCKKHPTEVCQIFCETCENPICLDCLCGDHKGHPTVRIKDRKEKLHTEIKLCATELSAKKDALAYETTNLEQERVKAQKYRKDELEILRKEYEQKKKIVEKKWDDKVQEMQRKIDTSVAEADQLENMLHKIRDVNDSTSMTSIMSILQDMQDAVCISGQQALGTPPPKIPTDPTGLSNLRRQLDQLVQEVTDEFKFDGTQAAVLKTTIEELQDFARGKGNAKPSSLKCPAAGEAYVQSTSMKSLVRLPHKAARQIATLVGADPLVFVNTRGPGNHVVLTTQDNKPQHVYTGLREMTGAQRWLWGFLPVGLKVSEAVRLALGYTPARVQDTYNDHRRVEREMLLEVWDKGLNDFEVWEQ